MTGPEAAARQVVVEACRRLDRLGLVHATAGNVSMRLGPDLLVTPAGAPLGALAPEDLVRLPLPAEGGGPAARAQAADGAAGRRPSSELPMHLALYRLSGVAAVVHTHSPYATALSFQGRELPLATDEARLVLGGVPTVPYAPPGSEALAEAVGRAAAQAGDRAEGAAILARHGVVTWAGDLARAVALAELVEATARLVYIRETWGRAGAAEAEDAGAAGPGAGSAAAPGVARGAGSREAARWA